MRRNHVMCVTWCVLKFSLRLHFRKIAFNKSGNSIIFPEKDVFCVLCKIKPNDELNVNQLFKKQKLFLLILFLIILYDLPDNKSFTICKLQNQSSFIPIPCPLSASLHFYELGLKTHLQRGLLDFDSVNINCTKSKNVLI